MRPFYLRKRQWSAPGRWVLRWRSHWVAGLIAVGWFLVALQPLPAQTQADPEQGAPAQSQQPRAAPGMRSATTARHNMVVTANPHATQAGMEILEAGGNAVDALIAAQFALNVVEPQSSGIGGGGFLLLYGAADGVTLTIDGREEAPATVTPDWFLQADGTPEPFWPDRITGGKAVAVPGLLRALDKASRLRGRLDLARTLVPAIRLAEGGFPVSPRLSGLLARQRERLVSFPATRAVFFTESNAGPQPLQAGTWLRQPHLAATFRLIAAEGADAFYQGSLAQDIVASVNEAPVRAGKLTLSDLAGYRAPLREPVRGSYRNYEIVGMGPPSSGGVTLIQMLQLLEAKPSLSPPADPRSAAAIHGFVVAARLAYADRAQYLADGDFVPVPVQGLLDPAYAEERAGQVNWEDVLTPVEAGLPAGANSTTWGLSPSGEHASTTHLVVWDREGNIAAATSSIEQAFGSGIMVPGRGFLLNNELTDFAAHPTDQSGRPVANRVQGQRRPRTGSLDLPQSLGGKRPRSSMAPTLVFRDQQPVLVIGSPGGARIIQYVAWVLLLVLEYGWDLQRAIEFPHVTHLGGHTVLEPGWQKEQLGGPALLDALTAKGHQVVIAEQNSGLHGIQVDPRVGLLHSGVDPRREGAAAGD